MLHADPDLPSDARPIYRQPLHWLAIAVVLSVFPLIWMGGLVTTHGAGMSVPDWPNSYGYNMFLFPPSKWLGGIFYEHTHRLLGTLSGFLAIALALTAWGPAHTAGKRRAWTIAAGLLWGITLLSILAAVGLHLKTPEAEAARLAPHFAVGFASLALIATIGIFCRTRESRRWVRWLVLGELAAVCVQGTLGGMRVDLVNVELAMVHGCFAQLFLCLAAFTALTLSKWWITADDRSETPEAPAGRRARLLAGVCFGVIFCQLIAGAIMRHSGAGLAIPDLPLAFGKLLPPTNQAQLDAANAWRSWTYHLSPVSMAQVWMHFTHRMGALLVTASVGFFGIYTWRKLPRGRAIRRVAAILCSLVVVQFTLGVLTVWLQKPADVASMHVATGALTLMTASQAFAVAWRVYARQHASREVVSVDRPESVNLATVHA